jgi:hypothetical protein
MAGGFLMGLGQGLQKAAGTVGEYAEGQRRQKALDENARQFDLSHELAVKANRDVNNRAGVEDLYRQGRMQLDEKLAGNQINESQYRMMNADAQLQQGQERLRLDARQLEGQLGHYGAMAGYYKAMGDAQGQKYQDRLYAQQRMIQMLDGFDRLVGRRQDLLKDPLTSTDPTKSGPIEAEIDDLMFQRDFLTNQAMGSMLGPDEAAALKQALDARRAARAEGGTETRTTGGGWQ